MAEKKPVNETDLMTLLTLHMELGDASYPDPNGRRTTDLKRQKLDPEMEGTVKRLIAHLKDEK